MLTATGFRAERVGPSLWRLKREHATTAVGERPVVIGDDVVVTARKRSEILSGTAAPVAVFVPGEQMGGTSATLRDVASSIEGLSVTNSGPGRDRQFIRGMADSPFNGFSQTTVSVNIDDARVTYDAPEPGLRLVDVARVEVLKGPQGPLYGTGALGGVYRVVTNKPDLVLLQGHSSFGLKAMPDGGPGAEATAVANLPLLREVAALRLVGYAGEQGGWVKDAAGGRGLNDLHWLGGRAAARAELGTGWTVDLSGTWQNLSTDDSAYVDRGGDDLERSRRLPEPSSTDFRLASVNVAGSIGELRVTSTTSHAWQDRSDVYDTGQTSVAQSPAATRAYEDVRRHKVFDQEIRLASSSGAPLTWTAGISYLGATTFATGTVRMDDGTRLPSLFKLHRAVSEAAAFVDTSWSVATRLKAGLGGRIFRATTDDERSENSDASVAAKASIGVTPSGSLTYEITRDRVVYVRFGTAFRPGGLDPSNATTGRYDPDEVRSVDVGARLRLAQGRIDLTAGGFHSHWSDIQSDYLLPDGLVATRNAGNASITGAELALRWTEAGWRVDVGGTVQQARLEDGADGGDLIRDRRLPTIPDLSARFEVRRSLGPSHVGAELALGGTYVGRSRLSFDEGLDRRMGGYVVLQAEGRVTVSGLSIRSSITNLLDARADSFSFGNPFRVRNERQYTPLQPRTLMMTVAKAF